MFFVENKNTHTANHGRSEQSSASECYFDKITQILDAQDYLRIVKTRGNDIEDVKFIPPILGSGGFGRFKVTFFNGQYEEEF